MYHTIQLSSCITVQGEFIERLHDGRVAIRDGKTVYRGHPISRRGPVGLSRAPLAQPADRPAPRL